MSLGIERENKALCATHHPLEFRTQDGRFLGLEATRHIEERGSHRIRAPPSPNGNACTSHLQQPKTRPKPSLSSSTDAATNKTPALPDYCITSTELELDLNSSSARRHQLTPESSKATTLGLAYVLDTFPI